MSHQSFPGGSINDTANDKMKKNDEASDLQEKLQKVEFKSPSSIDLSVKNIASSSGVAKRSHESQKTTSYAKSSGSATGTIRNKTELAPGHSLMDWIRLGNSGVDLTGVGGVPRMVTFSELANHNQQTDAWIAIKGIVFNVTRYMNFHPGGTNELMRGVGRDATELFENVHAWVNYQSILQKCVVGRLCRSCTSLPTSITDTETDSRSTKSKTTQNTSATVQDEELLDFNIDWKQTTHSITFFYPRLKKYHGINYQLTKLNDSTIVLRIIFDKYIATSEIKLVADVEWPPAWRRDFQTMEVDFTFLKKNKEIWKSESGHATTKDSNTNERTYRKYEVVSNTPLCKVVRLLILRAKDFFEIPPIGRHVDLKFNVMGMEISRPYTPVPPCLHSTDMPLDYKSDCICLMVKRYENGALSPSITTLEPGQSVLLSNAVGTFVVESFDRYSVVHILAAGTGITAMLGIIQRALARKSVSRINLLNFNRDEENMFYVKQLNRVCDNPKFSVTHILSQAQNTWTGEQGTVSKELLKEKVGECLPESCIFTCGPKGFLSVVKGYLDDCHWKREQMFEFND